MTFDRGSKTTPTRILAPVAGLLVGVLGASHASAQQYSSARYDIALLVPDYVVWEIDRTGVGEFRANTQWGLPGDRFLAGEPMWGYRNGKDEAIVFRGDGLWYVKVNDTNPGYSGRYEVKTFGWKHSRPVVGDFNGDGRDEAAVIFNHSHYYSGGIVEADLWKMPQNNQLMVDGNGNLRQDNIHTGPDYWSQFPVVVGPKDQVLAGRFAYGSRDEIAIWRNDTGYWDIYTTGSNGRPTPNRYANPQFGLPGDIPMVGDVNADGRDDLMVFRPSSKRVFVNLCESGDINGGFGGIGDVDQIINYTYPINLVNSSIGWGDRPWTTGAVCLKFD
ncbi:MAG: hypothetical protein IT435_17640 [Phycisphaerales bacterium]|nr:hypothetical protein [Phycisphaerales bacterium]